MPRNLKEPYHIVPHRGEWVVKLLTGTGVIERYDTQDRAIQAAERMMEKNNRPFVTLRTTTGQFRVVSVNIQYLQNIERGL